MSKRSCFTRFGYARVLAKNRGTNPDNELVFQVPPRSGEGREDTFPCPRNARVIRPSGSTSDTRCELHPESVRELSEFILAAP